MYHSTLVLALTVLIPVAFRIVLIVPDQTGNLCVSFQAQNVVLYRIAL